MKAVPVEGTFPGRAQPAIVVDAGRRLAVRQRLGKATILYIPGLRDFDLAQDPGLQDLGRLGKYGAGAHLCSMLDDPLILASRIH